MEESETLPTLASSLEWFSTPPQRVRGILAAGADGFVRSCVKSNEGNPDSFSSPAPSRPGPQSWADERRKFHASAAMPSARPPTSSRALSVAESPRVPASAAGVDGGGSHSEACGGGALLSCVSSSPTARPPTLESGVSCLRDVETESMGASARVTRSQEDASSTPAAAAPTRVKTEEDGKLEKSPSSFPARTLERSTCAEDRLSGSPCPTSTSSSPSLLSSSTSNSVECFAASTRCAPEKTASLPPARACASSAAAAVNRGGALSGDIRTEESRPSSGCVSRPEQGNEVVSSSSSHAGLTWISRTHPSIIASPPSSPYPRQREGDAPLSKTFWLSPFPPPSKDGADGAWKDNPVGRCDQPHEKCAPAFASSSACGDDNGRCSGGVADQEEDAQRLPSLMSNHSESAFSSFSSSSLSCSSAASSCAAPAARAVPPAPCSTVAEVAALFDPCPCEDLFLESSPATADLTYSTLLPGSAFLEREFVSSLSLSLPAVISFLFSLFNGDPRLGLLTPTAKFMAWRSLVYLADLHSGKLSASPASVETAAGALGRGGYRAAAARGPFYRGSHAQQSSASQTGPFECVATSKGKRSVRHAVVGDRPASSTGSQSSSVPPSLPATLRSSGPLGTGAPTTASSHTRGLFGKAPLASSRPPVSQDRADEKRHEGGATPPSRSLGSFDFFKIPRTSLPGLPRGPEGDSEADALKAAEDLWAAARAANVASATDVSSTHAPAPSSSGSRRQRGSAEDANDGGVAQAPLDEAGGSGAGGSLAKVGAVDRASLGGSGLGTEEQDAQQTRSWRGEAVDASVQSGVPQARRTGPETAAPRSEADRSRRGQGGHASLEDDKGKLDTRSEASSSLSSSLPPCAGPPSSSRTASSVRTSSSPQGETQLQEQISLLLQSGDEQQVVGYEENFPRFVCGTIDRRWALQQRTVKVPLDKTVSVSCGNQGAKEQAERRGSISAVEGSKKKPDTHSESTAGRDRGTGSMMLELQFEEIRYSAAKRMWPRKITVLPERLAAGLQVQVACYAKVLERGDNSVSSRESRLGWTDEESRLVWRDGEVTKVLPASGEIYVRVQASYQDYKSMKYSVTDFVPPSVPVARPHDKLWRLRPPLAEAAGDLYPGSCICMSITPTAPATCATGRPVFYVDAVVHQVFYSTEDARECRRRCAKYRAEHLAASSGLGAQTGSARFSANPLAGKKKGETQAPAAGSKRRRSGGDEGKASATGLEDAKKQEDASKAPATRSTRLQLRSSSARESHKAPGRPASSSAGPPSVAGKPRTRSATSCSEEPGAARDRRESPRGFEGETGEGGRTTRPSSPAASASVEMREVNEREAEKRELPVESLVHPIEGLRCPRGRKPVEIHVLLLSGGSLTEDVCRVAGRQILKLPYDLHAHFDELAPDTSRHLPADSLPDKCDEAASEKGEDLSTAGASTATGSNAFSEELGAKQLANSREPKAPKPPQLSSAIGPAGQTMPMKLPRASSQASAFMWVVPRALSHEVAYTAKGRTRTFSSDYFFPALHASGGASHHSDHRGGQGGTPSSSSLSAAPCLADPSRWESRTKDRAKDWLDYPPFVLCCFRFHPDSRYYRGHTQLLRYLQPELDITALTKGSWKLKFPVYRAQPEDGGQLFMHPSRSALEPVFSVAAERLAKSDEKRETEGRGDGKRPGSSAASQGQSAFAATPAAGSEREDCLELSPSPDISSGAASRKVSSAEVEKKVGVAVANSPEKKRGELDASRRETAEEDEQGGTASSVKEETAQASQGAAKDATSHRWTAEIKCEQLARTMTSEETSSDVPPGREGIKRKQEYPEEDELEDGDRTKKDRQTRREQTIAGQEKPVAEAKESAGGATIHTHKRTERADGREDESRLVKRGKIGWESPRDYAAWTAGRRSARTTSNQSLVDDRQRQESDGALNSSLQRKRGAETTANAGAGAVMGMQGEDAANGAETVSNAARRLWTLGDIKERLWRFLANDRARRSELAREHLLLQREDEEDEDSAWQLRAAAAAGGVVMGQSWRGSGEGVADGDEARPAQSLRPAARGLEAYGMRFVAGIGRGPQAAGAEKEETDRWRQGESGGSLLASDPWRGGSVSSSSSPRLGGAKTDDEDKAEGERVGTSGLSISDVARFLLKQQPLQRAGGEGTAVWAALRSPPCVTVNRTMHYTPSSLQPPRSDASSLFDRSAVSRRSFVSPRDGEDTREEGLLCQRPSAQDGGGRLREGRGADGRESRSGETSGFCLSPEGSVKGGGRELEAAGSPPALHGEKGRLLEDLCALEESLLRCDGASALVSLFKRGYGRAGDAQDEEARAGAGRLERTEEAEDGVECEETTARRGKIVLGTGLPYSGAGSSADVGHLEATGEEEVQRQGSPTDADGGVESQSSRGRVGKGSSPFESGESSRRPSHETGVRCKDAVEPSRLRSEHQKKDSTVQDEGGATSGGERTSSATIVRRCHSGTSSAAPSRRSSTPRSRSLGVNEDEVDKSGSSSRGSVDRQGGRDAPRSRRRDPSPPVQASERTQKEATDGGRSSAASASVDDESARRREERSRGAAAATETGVVSPAGGAVSPTGSQRKKSSLSVASSPAAPCSRSRSPSTGGTLRSPVRATHAALKPLSPSSIHAEKDKKAAVADAARASRGVEGDPDDLASPLTRYGLKACRRTGISGLASSSPSVASPSADSGASAAASSSPAGGRRSPAGRRAGGVATSSVASSSRRSSTTSLVEGQSTLGLRNSPALSAASVDSSASSGRKSLASLPAGASGGPGGAAPAPYFTRSRQPRAAGVDSADSLSATVLERGQGEHDEAPAAEVDVGSPAASASSSRHSGRYRKAGATSAPGAGSAGNFASTPRGSGAAGEDGAGPRRAAGHGSSASSHVSSRRGSGDVPSSGGQISDHGERERDAASGQLRRPGSSRSSVQSHMSADHGDQTDGGDPASAESASRRATKRRIALSRTTSEAGVVKATRRGGGLGDQGRVALAGAQSKRPRRAAAEGASRAWTEKHELESRVVKHSEDVRDATVSDVEERSAARDSDEDFEP
ncbi:hypothetical protein BESB_023640 [Besnoitia besnoiti]|uniref:Uncharacterized protein n=1 Tax=Besnoitia besnoiti TaxID=94643 RepID=A0A2A9M910_BESBE|nr:hypothetical protein BESB_023640 [Besnoitia besnoiti]PFH31872.1 hypothetical protein BESB_023640 [Besnoitia besnoiti]